MLKASNFHEKHINFKKGFKKRFEKMSITWQQAKNNRNFLHVLYTTKLYYLLIITQGDTKNDIWQMDGFHFTEFVKQKYMHNTFVYVTHT